MHVSMKFSLCSSFSKLISKGCPSGRLSSPCDDVACCPCQCCRVILDPPESYCEFLMWFISERSALNSGLVINVSLFSFAMVRFHISQSFKVQHSNRQSFRLYDTGTLVNWSSQPSYDNFLTFRRDCSKHAVCSGQALYLSLRFFPVP